MSVSDIMQQMADAGAPFEAILVAVRALEAKDAEIEARRAGDRERKRRQRDRDRDSHGTVTGHSGDGHASTPAPSSPLEPPNTPTPVKTNTPRARKGRFPAPEGVSEGQWEAFSKQRKKPFNDHSYGLLCGKLRRLAEDGWPPGDLIDRAVESGWETVYEPKDYSNGRTKQVGSVGGNKPDPFDAYRAQIAIDLAAEEASSSDPRPAGGHGSPLPAH